jgi:hypothetical protein
MRLTLMALSIVSLLWVCAASAKKERQWQTGTLLRVYEARVDPRSVKVPSSLADVSVAKDLVDDTYEIDAGEYICQSQEIRKSKHQPPPFMVHGSLQFAIENDRVYIKDEEGKEHNTKLIQRKLKTGVEGNAHGG